MINRASLATPFRLLPASAIMICMLTKPSLVLSSLVCTEGEDHESPDINGRAGHAAMSAAGPTAESTALTFACRVNICSPEQGCKHNAPGSYRSF